MKSLMEIQSGNNYIVKEDVVLRVNMKDLDKRSKTPIFTYCRKLIKDGFDPRLKLHVFREKHSEPDVIVNSIGDAAKLNVFEDDRHPPTFVKFKEWHPSSLPQKKNKLEEDV